jgi:hypothetical protein
MPERHWKPPPMNRQWRGLVLNFSVPAAVG